MRLSHLVFISYLSASFLAGHVTAMHMAHAEAKRAAIVSDEKAGVLRFMIDGKEVAYLDAHGFNVLEDIGFGGVLTDYGQAEFKRRAIEVGDGN